MRHNQNNRHQRGGRRNNNNSRRGGGNSGGQRTNAFDSNGPDVRVRGNASQINDKYLSLARDAASAGDTVLAESYFQYAEHYQRIVNEANEAKARYQQQPEAQQAEQQPKPDAEAKAKSNANGAAAVPGEGEQPALDDLDQSFLVGTVTETTEDGKKVQKRGRSRRPSKSSKDAPLAPIKA